MSDDTLHARTAQKTPHPAEWRRFFISIPTGQEAFGPPLAANSVSNSGKSFAILTPSSGWDAPWLQVMQFTLPTSPIGPLRFAGKTEARPSMQNKLQ
jgi:hypothetical protein